MKSALLTLPGATLLCLGALAVDRLRARRKRFKLEQANIELRSANRTLAELAAHDPLTGLYNRRYFYEMLGTEFERSRRHHRPLTVLMVDIDDFKRINDEHGHIQADCVLAELADVLREDLRQSDVVARYGGDEFALILPETEQQSGRLVAEKLRERVAGRPLVGAGVATHLTVSIGVAGLDQTLMSEDGLMRLTDEALYRAKAAGRNRVECAPDTALVVMEADGRRRRMAKTAVQGVNLIP